MVGSCVIQFFLMFSGVLISFLWFNCNLELKLESYDHFEGKKLSEYTLLWNINAKMMSFIIHIFLFHIIPLWLSGIYLINNNRVVNSSCVPAVWSHHGCQEAKAVSMRWAVDGVVIPTNTMRGVFVTSTMDNLDESGRYEFHGTAMTLTSHPTQDNMGEDPPTLDYNVPEGTSVQVPADFEFVPYLN